MSTNLDPDSPQHTLSLRICQLQSQQASSKASQQRLILELQSLQSSRSQLMKKVEDLTLDIKKERQRHREVMRRQQEEHGRERIKADILEEERREWEDKVEALKKLCSGLQQQIDAKTNLINGCLAGH